MYHDDSWMEVIVSCLDTQDMAIRISPRKVFYGLWSQKILVASTFPFYTLLSSMEQTLHVTPPNS